jgi:hypothetical protein
MIVTPANRLSGQSPTHPDLQGIWTNATLTPLERPAGLTGKPVLTDAEAAVFEKRSIAASNIDRRDGDPEADRSRAYNNLFIDRGSELARVDGTKRTARRKSSRVDRGRPAENSRAHANRGPLR